jgi:hypothetical protein
VRTVSAAVVPKTGWPLSGNAHFFPVNGLMDTLNVGRRRRHFAAIRAGTSMPYVAASRLVCVAR